MSAVLDEEEEHASITYLHSSSHGHSPVSICGSRIHELDKGHARNVLPLIILNQE